jgi:hypothetical protein
MRQHRARRRGANIKKERSLAFQNTSDFCNPFFAPLQIGFAALPVGIFSVFNPEIVWRRRDRYVDATIGQLRHSSNAVAKAEIVRKEAKQLLPDGVLDSNHVNDSYQSDRLYRKICNRKQLQGMTRSGAYPRKFSGRLNALLSIN